MSRSSGITANRRESRAHIGVQRFAVPSDKALSRCEAVKYLLIGESIEMHDGKRKCRKTAKMTELHRTQIES